MGLAAERMLGLEGNPSLAGVGRQPSSPRRGSRAQSTPNPDWQQRATEKLEQKFVREEVWPALSDRTRALMRSQHGPLASAPLTAPTSKAIRLEPSRPASSCVDVCTCSSLCPCALADVAANLHVWPSSGHHRAACAVVGVLGRRWPLPKCAVREKPRSGLPAWEELLAVNERGLLVWCCERCVGTTCPGRCKYWVTSSVPWLLWGGGAVLCLVTVSALTVVVLAFWSRTLCHECLSRSITLLRSCRILAARLPFFGICQ